MVVTVDRLFLSYRFRQEDSELAALVKELVLSHNVECITGKNLAGEPLERGVNERLLSANAVIALFLKPMVADDFHKWIFREYMTALDKKIPSIAVVEEGFFWPDLGDKEYVELKRDAPLAAFLKLSHTIGTWRKKAGRTIPILLRPPMHAQHAYAPSSSCRYRLKRQFQAITDWIDVKPDRSANGIGFEVRNVPDDAQIEIEVKDVNGSASYFSVADLQVLSVELISPENR